MFLENLGRSEEVLKQLWRGVLLLNFQQARRSEVILLNYLLTLSLGI